MYAFCTPIEKTVKVSRSDAADIKWDSPLKIFDNNVYQLPMQIPSVDLAGSLLTRRLSKYELNMSLSSACYYCYIGDERTHCHSSLLRSSQI